MSSVYREPTPLLKAQLQDIGLSQYASKFRQLALGSTKKLSCVPQNKVEQLIEKGIGIKINSVDGIKMLTMFNLIYCGSPSNRNYVNLITPEPPETEPIKQEKEFIKKENKKKDKSGLLIEGMSEISEEEFAIKCEDNNNHNSAININIGSVSAVPVREQNIDDASLQKKRKKRVYILWDQFHEKKLRSLHGEYVNDWEKISAEITVEFGIKRTAHACHQKWNKISSVKPRIYYERKTKNDIKYDNKSKKRRKKRRRSTKIIKISESEDEFESLFDATAKPKSFSINRIPASKKQRL